MSWKLTLGLSAGALGLALLAHRRRSAGLEAVPAWWNSQHPRDKWQRVCYTSKRDALKVFADYNVRVIEDWGGLTAEGSAGEFDAINHKYRLRGKDKVKTIAEALWVAMPKGRPFCLDRIDLDALNDTSPAAEHHVGFQLPGFVEDELADREAATWYEEIPR